MATAHVVITKGSSNTPAVGGLFAGVSFFLLQRLPSRSRFVEQIQANGGRVVKQESQADYIIADHVRHDCPAGSTSYTFIETAIKNGELPDPNNHRAARSQGAPREAGSAAATKGTRTPFTAEDDKVLWNWVKGYEQKGGLVKGNEIYKQLEAQNARHTWQAWRDRYVKRLMNKPPAHVLTVPANPPPTPPTAQDQQVQIGTQEEDSDDEAAGKEEVNQEIATKKAKSEPEEEAVEEEDEMEQDLAPASMEEENKAPEMEEEDLGIVEVEQTPFTEGDLDVLLRQAHDIENIDPGNWDDAWKAWADAFPDHSAKAWENFWYETALPAYKKLKERQENASDFEDEEEDENLDEQCEPFSVSKDQPEFDGASDARDYPLEDEDDACSGQSKLSTSQKRKRAEHRSSPEKSYGRKRPRSSSHEVFGQESSSEGDAVEEDVNALVPTPELNKEAQEQLERESKKQSEATSEELDSQARGEVLDITRKVVQTEAHSMSDLPTSDANRAADEQLSRESVEGADEDMEESESVMRSPSIHSQEEPRSAQSQVKANTTEELLEQPGDKLTEANLASQQAEHKAQLLRGTDIPEDDDARDEDQQDEFVRYLQGITRQSYASRPVPADTLKALDNIGFTTAESQPLQTQIDTAIADLNANQIEELPISSQQEIDDAVDNLIQWPESPDVPSRPKASQSHSQSARLETQIPYPDLQSQGLFVSQQEGEESLSSQPSMLPEVSYPSLAPPEETTRAPHPVLGSMPSSQSIFARSQEKAVSARDESQAAVEEDETDLSIAAPVGGWPSSQHTEQLSWSLSPANRRSNQSLQATPLASQQQTQINQERQPPPDTQAQSQTTSRAQNVLEISSGSSSSSDSSSELLPTSKQTVTSRKRPPETQDLLNAETQRPDFDMPLPPDSDDELSARDSISNHPSPIMRPNALDSQRALAETQRLSDEDVGSYIDKMVFRGYKDASVIAALKCTSMRSELAELVLLEEKAGKGLPADVAGIWSEKEDKVLEGGDAKALRMLEVKHGWPEMEQRMEFLEEWRDGDEDE